MTKSFATEVAGAVPVDVAAAGIGGIALPCVVEERDVVALPVFSDVYVVPRGWLTVYITLLKK